MTLFTNLRLLREMNLDIQLQAFQMPMLGLKPKVLIQRFHLRCFCLKTTSRTWLTKYSQTYLLFLPFFYFIEICIQKSVFLPQMYSSMSVLQPEHLCFNAKIKKQHHLALELSHSLVRILCFPLQIMLRIRLKKKKLLVPAHLYLPGDKPQTYYMRRYRKKAFYIFPETCLKGPALPWMVPCSEQTSGEAEVFFMESQDGISPWKSLLWRLFARFLLPNWD